MALAIPATGVLDLECFFNSERCAFDQLSRVALLFADRPVGFFDFAILATIILLLLLKYHKNSCTRLTSCCQQNNNVRHSQVASPNSLIDATANSRQL